MRVGVFDSGFGSLSIVQAIRETLPSLDLLVGMDRKNFPYGTKTEEEVTRFLVEMIEEVLPKYPLDLMVIACNTASTVALPDIRKRYPIPIVGVVPAIKPAASITKTKRIGLLATPGTIQRAYTKELIEKFAQDCKVISIGSSRLVDMAEKKIWGVAPDLELIRQELQPFFSEEKSQKYPNQQIDTVILGSTHFPLLLPELEKALDHPVSWINPAIAIARRVKSLLPDTFSGSGKTLIYFTLTPDPKDIPKAFFEKHKMEVIGL